MSKINYSPSFLHEFSVIEIPYTYIEEKDGLVEVPLRRENSTKKYAALVRAIVVGNKPHQCAIYGCDLWNLQSCIGCRCLAGSRKDGKCVKFEIEYIYQID